MLFGKEYFPLCVSLLLVFQVSMRLLDPWRLRSADEADLAS